MNAVKFYRVGHWCYTKGIPVVPRLIYYLIYLIYNASIPMNAEIGEDTKFGYGGMGVVLHSSCRIGRNVYIAQQVTIGGHAAQLSGAPRSEDGCIIGASAKLGRAVRL